LALSAFFANAIEPMDSVTSTHEASSFQLRNKQVTFVFDQKQNTWDGVWGSGVDAATHKASFALEIDGKTLHARSAVTEIQPFHDKMGSGKEIVQRWTNGIEVLNTFRVYDDRPGFTISAHIRNPTAANMSLGTQHMIDLYGSTNAGWKLGRPNLSPASVYVAGFSELQCLPADSSKERDYNSSSFLGLSSRESGTGLVVGFLTTFQGFPNLNAKFETAKGGTRLLAHEQLNGRLLGPGESLELDPVYVIANTNSYVALEQYGDAVAAFAQEPVRTKATALWCSWYAHRMALSEDLVLANAAVAAKYFKPLGFEIMQMDHGWERGDITGDWVPNERFPHGLRWLSDQLKERYGLRLGAWIAPTDVAEPSATYQKHSEWMLKGANGQPLVNWKWYWKPNPNCYELDASNPDAAKWIEKTFAQLTDWGVSYYKIDFIAASGGQHFIQSDPKVTRGWGVLRSAMEALRRGAGTNAWIRYCQTPPVLSAGLADSVIGGTDTLDAGLNGNIDVLRTSARSLAAGYWLNDRDYHREVCDMSVRMHADVEEVRLRLAIMTLAGCSISFSDEFQYLPPSRIRMMQACLPPGNPPMKPIDLFERAIPSIWRVHCKNDADEWDIVGLFNFESKPEDRTLDFGALGFGTNVDATVFEFWEQKFLGLKRDKFTMTLPPQTSRILAIHKASDHPQIVGTDMHLLQGYHELKQLGWDDKAHVLSGQCERMPGVSGQLFIYVPNGFSPHFDFPLTEKSAALTHISGNLWAHEINFAEARESWKMPFDR